MGMIEVDENELNATRSQAAEMLPWRNEAHRLAEVVYNLNRNHPILRGEIWKGFVEKKQKDEAEGRGWSPDHEGMHDIVSAAPTGITANARSADHFGG